MLPWPTVWVLHASQVLRTWWCAVVPASVAALALDAFGTWQLGLVMPRVAWGWVGAGVLLALGVVLTTVGAIYLPIWEMAGAIER